MRLPFRTAVSDVPKPRSSAQYEYQVIASPKRAKKVKGVRNHQDRFAAVLTELMNEMAADGWEYQRADSLPCEEKSGFARWVASFQTVLVFRRAIPQVPEAVPIVEEFEDLQHLAEPEMVDPDDEPELQVAATKPSLPGFRRDLAPVMPPHSASIEEDDDAETPPDHSGGDIQR